MIDGEKIGSIKVPLPALNRLHWALSPPDLFFTLPCSTLYPGQLTLEDSHVFWLLAEFS